MANRRVKRWLIALIALHGVYASAFIARSSFVIEGQRYFCLVDDAMITLQFARNLAEGHGLVWNAGGERVEGFSSPLWTLLLALVAYLDGERIRTCLDVQLIGIPIVWATAIGAFRLANACRMPGLVAWIACIWALVYYNLNYLALLGMESALAAAVFTWGMVAVVRAVRAGRGSAGSMWWAGPLTLLRPEALAFGLYVTGVQTCLVRRDRWRPVVGVQLSLLLLAGYVGWRFHYYGQFAPNTYFLKLTGWPLADRLMEGLRRLSTTLVTLMPLGFLAIAFVGKNNRRMFWMLAAPALLAAAYQVYVGGDHVPRDRFVVPFVPALMVMSAAGLVRLSRLVRMMHGPVARRWAIRAGALVVVVLLNAISLPHSLLLSAPQCVRFGNLHNVESAIVINRHTPPDATVAVGFAGTIPYFTGRYCIDLLGRCDAHIARLPARLGLRPGHNKFDYDWSIAHYQPDVICSSKPEMYAEPSVHAEYQVQRFFVDDAAVFLLIRRGAAVTGGEPIAWNQIDQAVFVGAESE